MHGNWLPVAERVIGDGADIATLVLLVWVHILNRALRRMRLHMMEEHIDPDDTLRVDVVDVRKNGLHIRNVGIVDVSGEFTMLPTS